MTAASKPVPDDVEAIARGLTRAQRIAFLSARMTNHGNGQLYSSGPTSSWLQRNNLASGYGHGLYLTPLGLAVRAHLIAQGETA